MEIWTLIRANVRHKKGSFVSVILLTLIIVVSVTTILSVRESLSRGADRAFAACNVPDVSVMYLSNQSVEGLAEEIRRHDSVERADVTECIYSSKAFMGDGEYGDLMMLVRADGDTRILKADLSGIADDTPALQKGEIYVTLGFLSVVKGKVGEEVALQTAAGEYVFTVKGILLDPVTGSSMIGWKRHCISEEDFGEITAAVLRAGNGNRNGLGEVMKIWKNQDCTLTSGQFRRQLNLDTGVTDMAHGSQTRDLARKFTLLFPEVILSILMVFVLFLMASVVIVVVHGIAVEIETNYVTLGVLKAQGFGKGKIRLLFLGQYVLAELIGATLGVCLSIPLIGSVSNVFVTITAIPTVTSIPAGAALLVVSLFALSAAAIFLVTVRVDGISPVRAISGAKREVYFVSRVNVPISKRLLAPSLALRQFTSAKRRYAGSMAITAILVFFMMTVTAIADVVDSKAALEAMGALVSEIRVRPKAALSEEEVGAVKAEIERFSKVLRVERYSNSYFSLNGEETYGIVQEDPSLMPVLKGRSPRYDNEVAVSSVLMDEFDLKVGDEVTVGRRGKKETYLISGTVQLTNDGGRSFLISREAAERIGFDAPLSLGFSLEDGGEEEQNQEIAETLNEKFGDRLEAGAYSNLLGQEERTAVAAMQALIYVCSVLFSLIVVSMVCSKTFLQERVDIGIFKAMGFQARDLRLQFAFRFFAVSALGAAVGGALSCLFSGKLLSVLLKSIGITHFIPKMGLSSFVVPAAVTCASFFVFSYLVSGRIRKVKVRELATE